MREVLSGKSRSNIRRVPACQGRGVRVAKVRDGVANGTGVGSGWIRFLGGKRRSSPFSFWKVVRTDGKKFDLLGFSVKVQDFLSAVCSFMYISNIYKTFSKYSHSMFSRYLGLYILNSFLLGGTTLSTSPATLIPRRTLPLSCNLVGNPRRDGLPELPVRVEPSSKLVEADISG